MAQPSLPAVLLTTLLLLAVPACTEGETEDGSGNPDEANPDAGPGPTYDFGEPGTGMLRYSAELTPLNDSGVQGRAVLDADEEGVTVTVFTNGLSSGPAHAQHLHLGGARECPGADATGDDEILTAVEGESFYGPVAVSLTTSGDVGPESALALERFPVAVDNAVGYARTIELPAPIIPEDLNGMVIVQHGMATLGGDPAAYDGDEPSSLDPDLPLEATIPVACGVLQIDERPSS